MSFLPRNRGSGRKGKIIHFCMISIHLFDPRKNYTITWLSLFMDEAKSYKFSIGNEVEGNAVNYKPSEHCIDKHIIHASYSIFYTYELRTKQVESFAPLAVLLGAIFDL